MQTAIKIRKKGGRNFGFALSVIKLSAFILFSSCLCLGCKKDNSALNNTNQTANDKYYVKYIVSSSTIYSGGQLNLTIKTENNVDKTIVISQRTKSETIIGPVAKGFEAKLRAKAIGNTFDKLKLYSEIQISKNNDPFALKAMDDSDTPRDEVQLNYTINY